MRKKKSLVLTASLVLIAVLMIGLALLVSSVETSYPTFEAGVQEIQKYGNIVLDVEPEKLQEAALLRIANPEASLADLAVLSYPPVTKSCLSYRLKKIVEFHPEDE